VKKFEGHKGWVFSIQFQDNRLISGAFDSKIKIWDMDKGAELHTMTGHNGFVICLRFDSQRIISGSGDKTVKIWDFEKVDDSAKIDDEEDKKKCVIC